MNTVLIHKDQKKIKQATDFFNSSIQFLQSANDKLRKAGYTLDFDELVDIVTITATTSADIEWFRDRLNADRADTNIVNIKAFIVSHFPVGLGIYRFEPNLMCYKNGVIHAKEEALNIIEQRFSFYAENELGAELSTKLFNVSDAFNAFVNCLLDHNVKVAKLNADIPGLTFDGSQYKPDISFIRDQERMFKAARKKPNTRTISDAA